MDSDGEEEELAQLRAQRSQRTGVADLVRGQLHTGDVVSKQACCCSIINGAYSIALAAA